MRRLQWAPLQEYTRFEVQELWEQGNPRIKQEVALMVEDVQTYGELQREEFQTMLARRRLEIECCRAERQQAEDDAMLLALATDNAHLQALNKADQLQRENVMLRYRQQRPVCTLCGYPFDMDKVTEQRTKCGKSSKTGELIGNKYCVKKQDIDRHRKEEGEELEESEASCSSLTPDASHNGHGS